jgi:hypothetical protein
MRPGASVRWSENSDRGRQHLEMSWRSSDDLAVRVDRHRARCLNIKFNALCRPHFLPGSVSSSSESPRQRAVLDLLSPRRQRELVKPVMLSVRQRPALELVDHRPG